MKSLLATILLISCIGIAAAAIQVPQLPHEFYGTVIINAEPAPVGTVITATIGGEERGNFTTEEAGTYGGSGTFDLRLLVMGSVEDVGEQIIFLINGYEADQVAEFSPGTVTVVDLTVEYEEPSPPSTPTATPAPTAVPRKLPAGNKGAEPLSFDENATVLTSEEGKVLRDAIVYSSDGYAKLIIEMDTYALSEEKTPLESVSLNPTTDISLDNDSDEYTFAGYAYDCLPDGATFDPPITFSLSFSEDEWAEFGGEDLIIRHFSPETGEWHEEPTEQIDEEQSVQSECGHFSTMALFYGSPELPATEEEPGAIAAESEPLELEIPTDVTPEGGISLAYLGAIIIIIVVLVGAGYLFMQRGR